MKKNTLYLILGVVVIAVLIWGYKTKGWFGGTMVASTGGAGSTGTGTGNGGVGEGGSGAGTQSRIAQDTAGVSDYLNNNLNDMQKTALQNLINQYNNIANSKGNKSIDAVQKKNQINTLLIQWNPDPQSLGHRYFCCGIGWFGGCYARTPELCATVCNCGGAGV